MSDPDNHPNRKEIVADLTKAIEKRYLPPFGMFFVMVALAIVIMLVSKLLLLQGMTAIWMRCLIAQSAGYVAFLALLWCWMHWAQPLPWETVESQRKVGFMDFLALPSIESWILYLCGGVIILTVLHVIAGLINVVWGAPELLAELWLDAGLATFITGKAKNIAPEGWFKTAIRRTLPLYALFMALSLILTLSFYFSVPEAHTMAEAFSALSPKP